MCGNFMFASTTAKAKANPAAMKARKKSSNNCERLPKNATSKAKSASSAAAAWMSAPFGPDMMIRPEGLWFMKVTKEDVPQIVEKYLTLGEADKVKESAAAN